MKDFLGPYGCFAAACFVLILLIFVLAHSDIPSHLEAPHPETMEVQGTDHVSSDLIGQTGPRHGCEGEVEVHGYRRKNGHYVRGYTRHCPDEGAR